MIQYFVVFHAEDDGELPRNDVIEYPKEISCSEDIRDIETNLSNEWFGDDREVILVNFKKL